MDPLLILLIGVVIVIGMIVVLRVNAFVALITAAIVVSLLSPGALAEKIERVAAAFGSVVAGIGIVIAMAAIIGKCLMDSGAADRIVRTFLKALGEKRASMALMGSGFVLSIPVFFDTVFYLLVPLARSLWRRTRKNYVLYICAIVAGGALTHTLVPPTPGPLLMAEQFEIDIGVMIAFGVLVGLPTAAIGLLICGMLNRRMALPMRPYSGEPEPEPLEESQLPGFFISVLPIILPVLLISANTVCETIANREHAARLRPGDVRNWPAFGAALLDETGAMARPAKYVLGRLPANVQQTIRQGVQTGEFSAQAQEEVRAALNNLLKSAGFYDRDAFVGVVLPDTAAAMVGKDLSRTPQAKIERVNRLILETVFSEQIRPHLWDTPRRKAAYTTAVLGDPNLALLLSAVIAMLVLFRNRRLSLKELGKTTEIALMSGGVVILITAGGGAFGAMLRAAGIQDSITSLIGTGGESIGLVILLLGFGVSAVMKVAQGSSTVAMITTAAMFAAMGISSQMLGCNIVYLALAIGTGSLVGSWMNDSGFWIFARMSVLTETEALKSWTILLALLGLIGMGFTLLFSRILPMA